LEKLHAVRGQYAFGMPEQRPTDALPMKLRQYGHHVDLGGVAAVSHEREKPHVLISQ
jgi:hypothetical protein